MCPTGLSDGTNEVKVAKLLDELKEVTNWFELGVYLEIPTSRLQEINEECKDIEECKIEMLLAWSQIQIPTWSALVAALTGIGLQSLANKIASKYGELRCNLVAR